MACENETTNCHHRNTGGSYVCIIVLYILLAIIIGSYIVY